jgi:DNA mismatch endonuclease (patch repair protein)
MNKWPGDSRREQTSFGELTRGQLMGRIRGVGNKTTERHLAILLRNAGPAGWRTHQALPGTPDFSWPAARVAVFVDGCFWHGHDCGKNVSPRTNAKAWREKIDRNKARDRRVNRDLRRDGWSVLRVWECSLANVPERCVARIRRRIEARVST